MGPRFRDWELPCVDITCDKVCQFVRAVLKLAIKAAGVKSECWANLIKLLRYLPKSERSTLICSASEAVHKNSSSWSDRDRYTIWRTLMDETASRQRISRCQLGCVFPGVGGILSGSKLPYRPKGIPASIQVCLDGVLIFVSVDSAEMKKDLMTP